MADINKASAIMHELVVNNNHGYSQIHRNGPDYDCSSSISKALHDAGFAVPLGCNTSSIYKYLINIGYRSIPKYSTPQKNDIWLRRRDTPLAKQKGSGHIAMMYSAYRVMEFSSSRGHPQAGDQTGTEAWIHRWNPERADDFEFLLRFTGKSKTKYYPKYTGNSYHIDTVFKKIGAPYGSWKKRKNVAIENNILGYTGTESQNLLLIDLAKKGKLKKA